MIDAQTRRKDSDALHVPWACPSSHISPSTSAAVLAASESGTAVQLIPLHPEPRFQQTHARGPITSFSKASRLRLLWLMAHVAIEHFGSALFLTLTYPSFDPQSIKHKTHLDTFLKRLHRVHPEASAVWKLEYTKNATPHFHLILFGLPFWHHSKVAKAWAEIVQSTHPSHLRAGVRIEKLDSRRKATHYLSKYLAKTFHLPPSHQGRIWGKTTSLAKLFSPTAHYLLTQPQFIQLRRLLDLLRKAQSRARRFTRPSNLNNSQRWFLNGPAVTRLLEALRIPKLPISAPT